MQIELVEEFRELLELRDAVERDRLNITLLSEELESGQLSAYRKSQMIRELIEEGLAEQTIPASHS